MKKICLLIILFPLISFHLYSQWEVCSNGLDEGQFNTICICGNSIFAGNNLTGIFLSTDNGDSWIEKTAGLPQENISCIIRDDDKIFVSNGDAGIFLSTDDGGNWSDRSGGVLNGVNTISLAKKGSKLFAVTSGSIFVTSDNGLSWSGKNNGIDQGDLGMLLKIFVFDDKLFVGGFGSTYISTDEGENWMKRTNGVEMFWVQAFAASGKNIISGNNSGIGVYISSNYGDSWNRTLENQSIASLASTGSYVFAGTHSQGMFYSSDNGNSWKHANEGLPDIDVLSFAINDKYLFAGTGYKVFRRKLSDFGITHVDEINPVVSFSVFPNPVRDKIILYNNNLQNQFVRLYDLLGNMVYESEIKGQVEEFVLESLQPGIYVLRIGSSSRMITKLD